MKRPHQSERKKQITRRRAFKKQTRRIASEKKRKQRRKRNYGKSKYVRKQLNPFNEFKFIPAPITFSFTEQPGPTIKFINKLEKLNDERRSVFIDLFNIKYIDSSAIIVLLSVMFTFKARNTKFNGNFPQDLALRKLITESEFFRYLSKSVGNKDEYTIGKENKIFTTANREVNANIGLVVMKEASKTIWGEYRICKGLQRTLLELMQNTNNHAGSGIKGAKQWWLSVNYDKANKKVHFCFVDYGVGIFESLKLKPYTSKWFGWRDKIKMLLIGGGNQEIFRLLLNGIMHATVTKQHFRGKGLPGIKQVFDRNQISDLIIISNDVYANIKEDKYYILPTEFHGTFVSWELNETNQNLQWNQ